MKKAKAPGLVSDIEKEAGETVKTVKEQISPGNFFEEFLRQILGGAKPLSSEQEKILREKEKVEAGEARAEVLRPFFMESPVEKERVYDKQQKEEAMKKMEMRKKAEKEAGMKILESPKGKTQRGSAFAFLKRKKTGIERKGGKF